MVACPALPDFCLDGEVATAWWPTAKNIHCIHAPGPMAKGHALVKKSQGRDPSYTLMNKNKPAKKYKSGSRTQRSLRFIVDAGGGASDSTFFIDIAQALSAINRRAYKQGCYYYVSKATVHNGGDAWVRFATLPDTWVTKEAYKRGERIFYEQLSRTMRDGNVNPAAVGKYFDFRVAASRAHDFSQNLLPCNYETNPASPLYNEFGSDEWTQSVVVSEDPDTATTHAGVEYTMHMLGGSDPGVNIGLIRSYASSRPQNSASEPEMPADFDTDVLTRLFNAGDTMDEVLVNIDDDYDEPPYERTLYTGEQSNSDLVVQEQVSVGGGSGEVAHSGAFCAPLGIVGVRVEGTGVGLIEINLELTPGPYHGVYAEAVQ